MTQWRLFGKFATEQQIREAVTKKVMEVIPKGNVTPEDISHYPEIARREREKYAQTLPLHSPGAICGCTDDFVCPDFFEEES